MTPADLSRTVQHAVRRAVDAGEIEEAEEVWGRVVVAPPRPGGYGDYATNAALQIASALGRPAPEVARLLRGRLLASEGVADVRVTGPGFLNIALDDGSRERSLVAVVARDGARYGYGDELADADLVLRVAVGDLRGQVVADTVVRLVEAQGGRARLSSTEGLALRTAPPTPAVPDPYALLGGDALRWALLSAAAHDRPVLDPATLLAQRAENPLFLVRYAHSRARRLVHHARDLGFGPQAGESGPEGAELVRVLGEWPSVLRLAARRRAPERLARELVVLAGAFFDFHDRCGGLLPLGGHKPLAAHRARLALAEAAGTVLAGGLSLLGVSAPEFV
ncbi:ArgS-related anticodon-binding protein NrtL [Streptomyces sp. NPDC049954]|uniref:ArgS-related anticodon-binding protein NrtL n=1 Tax=Streptomyces sp. NPDC049954 TaxID=3155779 RepID=UPI00343A2078